LICFFLKQQQELEHETQNDINLIFVISLMLFLGAGTSTAVDIGDLKDLSKKVRDQLTKYG
jgi:hypothetical protein